MTDSLSPFIEHHVRLIREAATPQEASRIARAHLMEFRRMQFDTVAQAFEPFGDKVFEGKDIVAMMRTMEEMEPGATSGEPARNPGP